MAAVYFAHDHKHGCKVALKVLKPELAAVLGTERFVVEIRTTASLQHPHILPLFDSGTAEGLLYYVIPYIEGETIRDRLNRATQFGVDDAIRLAREVAEALDYAHWRGIIHRDIKPEKILLHDRRAMVMVFGIALAVSAAAGGRMTEAASRSAPCATSASIGPAFRRSSSCSRFVRHYKRAPFTCSPSAVRRLNRGSDRPLGLIDPWENRPLGESSPACVLLRLVASVNWEKVQVTSP